MLDGIRRDTGADLAALKAMMVLPVLDAGPFRAFDVDRSIPALEWLEAQGLDRLVALRVSSDDLRPVFEHAVSDLTVDEVGPHARCNAADPANNLLQVAGARVEYDLSAPARPDHAYTFGTTEFLARGFSGYRWLREAERIGSFCTLRESIARTAAALGVRPGPRNWPPTDGRLVC